MCFYMNWVWSYMVLFLLHSLLSFYYFDPLLVMVLRNIILFEVTCRHGFLSFFMFFEGKRSFISTNMFETSSDLLFRRCRCQNFRFISWLHVKMQNAKSHTCKKNRNLQNLDRRFFREQYHEQN